MANVKGPERRLETGANCLGLGRGIYFVNSGAGTVEHQRCVPSIKFEGKSWRLKEAAVPVAKRATSV